MNQKLQRNCSIEPAANQLNCAKNSLKQKLKPNLKAKTWAFLCFILLGFSVQAATFTVTVNTDGTGAGTLRKAIADAELTVAPDTIVFALTGGGPYTFNPGSTYPNITKPLVIDGSSQSGFVSGTASIIRIDYTNDIWAFNITGASNVTIANIDFSRQSVTNPVGRGIQINNSTNVTVKNCWMRYRYQCFFINTSKNVTINKINATGSGWNSSLAIFNLTKISGLDDVLKISEIKFAPNANRNTTILNMSSCNSIVVANQTISSAQIVFDDTCGLFNNFENNNTSYFDVSSCSNLEFKRLKIKSIWNGSNSLVLNIINTKSHGNIKFTECTMLNLRQVVQISNGYDYVIEKNNFSGSGYYSSLPVVYAYSVYGVNLKSGLFMRENKYSSPSGNTNESVGFRFIGMSNILMSNGSVANTTLQFEDTCGLKNVSGANNNLMFSFESCENLRIEKVDLSYTTSPVGVIISISNQKGNSGFTIKNCNFKNRRRPIAITNGNDVTIEGNNFQFCGINQNEPAILLNTIGKKNFSKPIKFSKNKFGGLNAGYPTALNVYGIDSLLVSNGTTPNSDIIFEDTCGLNNIRGFNSSSSPLLYFTRCNFLTIEKLQLSNPLTNVTEGVGIQVDNVFSNQKVIIRNNAIRNRAGGMIVTGGTGIEIYQNDLRNTGVNTTNPGIRLDAVFSGGALAYSNKFGGNNSNFLMSFYGCPDLKISNGTLTGGSNIRLEDTSGANNFPNSGGQMLYFNSCKNLQIDKVDLSRPAGIAGTGVQVDNPDGYGPISVTNCKIRNRSSAIYINGSGITINKNDLQFSGSSNGSPAIYINSSGKSNGVVSVKYNKFGGTNANSFARFDNVPDLIISDGSLAGSNVIFEDTCGFANQPQTNETILKFNSCRNLLIDSLRMIKSGPSRNNIAISITGGSITPGPLTVRNCILNNYNQALNVDNYKDVKIHNNNFINSGANQSNPAIQLNRIIEESLPGGILMYGNKFGGSNANRTQTAVYFINMVNLNISDGSIGGTNITFKPEDSLRQVGSSNYVLMFNSTANVSIKKIDFSFAGISQSSTAAIYIINSNYDQLFRNYTIENCQIRNRRTAVSAAGGYDYTFQNLDVRNTGLNYLNPVFLFSNIRGIASPGGIKINTCKFGGTGSSSPLYFSNCVNLLISNGSRPNTNITLEDTSGFNFSTNDRLIYFNSCNKIVVDTVDFSSNNISSSYGIYADGGSSISVKNSNFKKRGLGVYFSSSKDLELKNNLFQSSGNSNFAIYLTNTSSVFPNKRGLQMSGNKFGGISSGGLFISGTNGLIISDGSVPNSDIKFENNNGADSIVATAIYLNQCVGGSVTGLNLSKTGTNAGSGLVLVNSNNIAVKGLTINNRGTGIATNGSNGISMQCCTITNCGRGLENFSGNLENNISFCTITGSNAGSAVFQSGLGKVIAKNNFWGSGGPTGKTTGNVITTNFVSSTPTCPAGEPEIEVSGNNQAIEDGNTVTSVINYTDLGNGKYSTTNPYAVYKNFVIKNSGEGDLRITNIAFSGTNGSDYSFDGLTTPDTIKPGTSDTFRIKCNPSGTGARVANIEITSNDSNETVFDFALTTNGRAPYVVTTTANSGAGSLRQAITDANGSAGIDFIDFSIGSGAQTISVTSSMIGSNEALIIDGTTQPGFSGTNLITINSGANYEDYCIRFQPGSIIENCAIRYLNFNQSYRTNQIIHYGLFFQNVRYPIVEKCAINGFRMAVQFNNCTDVTLINNDFRGCGDASGGRATINLNTINSYQLPGGMKIWDNLFGIYNLSGTNYVPNGFFYISTTNNVLIDTVNASNVSISIKYNSFFNKVTNAGDYKMYFQGTNRNMEIRNVVLSLPTTNHNGYGIFADVSNSDFKFKNLQLRNFVVGINFNSQNTSSANIESCNFKGTGNNYNDPALYLSGFRDSSNLKVKGCKFGNNTGSIWGNSAFTLNNCYNQYISNGTTQANIILEDTSDLVKTNSFPFSLTSINYNININKLNLSQTVNTGLLGYGLFSNGTNKGLSITNCKTNNRQAGLYLAGAVYDLICENNNLKNCGQDQNTPTIYIGQAIQWLVPRAVSIKGNSSGGPLSNSLLTMHNSENQLISNGSISGSNIIFPDSASRNFQSQVIIYCSNVSNFEINSLNLSRPVATSNTGFGINIGNSINSDYTKILNCTIKRRHYGVTVSNGFDVKIENNNFDSTGNDDNNTPIFVDNVNEKLIKGGLSIKNNRFGFGNGGLKLQRIKNLFIGNGTLGTPNVILENTCGIQNQAFGNMIQLIACDSARIEGVNLNRSAGNQAGGGIRVLNYHPGNTIQARDFSNIRIANNSIANRQTGIYVESGADITIDSNYMGRTGNSPALYLLGIKPVKFPGGIKSRGNRYGGPSNVNGILRIENMRDVIISDGSVSGTNIKITPQDSIFNSFGGSQGVIGCFNSDNFTIQNQDFTHRSGNIGNGIALYISNTGNFNTHGNFKIIGNKIQNRSIGIQITGGKDYEIVGNDIAQSGSDVNNPAVYLTSIYSNKIRGGVKFHANTFGGSNAQTVLKLFSMQNLNITDSSTAFSNFTMKDNCGLANSVININYPVIDINSCNDLIFNGLDISAPNLQRGYGINMSNSYPTLGNITVKNCNIQNRSRGVYFSTVADVYIDSNNFRRTGNSVGSPAVALENIYPIKTKAGVKAKGNLFGFSGSTVTAFYINNTSNLTIKNKPSANTDIVIEDTAGVEKLTDPLYIVSASNLVIDSLNLDYFSTRTGTAIYISNSAIPTAGRISISNCRMRNRNNGAYVFYGKDYRIVNNDFKNSGGTAGGDWACISLNYIIGDSIPGGAFVKNNKFGGTNSMRAFYGSNLINFKVSDTTLDNTNLIIKLKDSIRYVSSEVLRFNAINNLSIQNLDLSYASNTRGGTGISVSNTVIANIFNNTVANRSYGIYLQGNSNVLNDFKVNKNTLIDNDYGYGFLNALPTKLQSKNNIFECNTYAALMSGGNVTIDSSYWGNTTGPVSGPTNGFSISGGTFTFTPFLTTAPAVAPKPTNITLYGNNTLINHNDTITSALDSTFFGAMDADSLVVTFKLKLEGNGMFKFTNTPKIELLGAHKADFRVLNQPGSQGYFFNGDSLVFKVSFNAKDTGIRKARIRIKTSDCDKPAYYFGIEGRGLPGRTVLLDGVNDYLVSNANVNITGSQPRTLEFWFKKNSSAINSHIVGWGQAHNLNAPFGLYIANNSLMFYAWGTSDYNTGYTIDNNWHHYAATYDGTTVRTYVDGRPTPTPSAARTLNTVNSKLYMGVREDFDPVTYVGGRLDEVRVWSRELDSCEIQARKNAEIRGAQNGLRIYYRFNQGVAGGNNTAITTTVDSSGNGNFATYTNLTMNFNKSNLVGLSGITTAVKLPKYIEPEIVVLNKTNEIADNDITPATTDSTQYGEVIVGDSLVVTYKVKNTGTDTLKFTGSPRVQITGTDASQFGVQTQLPAYILKGDSSVFRIKFKPTSTGVKNARILINNNDCTEQPSDFSIQGDGKLRGAALSFDGTNDVAATAINSAFNTPNASVEAWVNLTSKASARRFVINKPATGAYRYEIYYDNAADRLACAFYIGGTYYRVNGTSAPSISTWYHIAATYDGTTIKLYENGSMVNSTAVTGVIQNVNSKISIGADDATPTTFPMSGSIDEVRVWDRALTATEISTYRNCEFTGPVCGNVAYFKFNQGKASGTNTGLDSLVDFWPNKLHATLMNFNLSGSTSNWVSPGGVVSGTNCTVAAQPEIVVLGNNTSIADDDITPSIADNTDFGAVASTDSTTVTFKIKNTGAGTLNISGSPRVVISGAGAAKFKLITTPGATVASGDSATFSIRFKPAGAGTYTATLTINNDDCDEKTFNFDVTGKGGEPEMELKGNNVSIADGDVTPAAADSTAYGTVDTLTSKLVRYKIKNTGTDTLKITGTPKVQVSGTNAADWTVVSMPPSIVKAGDSAYFIVKYKPRGIGSRTATISIANNDANENPYNFDVNGTGKVPCDSFYQKASSIGMHTSAITFTTAGGWKCFCDSQGKLLLSLKLAGTGAVIPDNGVTLKIVNNGASFYPHGVGFVGNYAGWSALNRTWDVAPTTQPTSKVPVRYYFTTPDIDSINQSLVMNGFTALPSVYGMSFYKVTNSAKPAHAAVPTLGQSDVNVYMHGTASTDTSWILGNNAPGSYFAEFKVNSFSGGGGGGGSSGATPLAVKNIALQANAMNNEFVQLKWVSNAETDALQYVVERSANGTLFTTVGTVTAANTGAVNSHYMFNDKTAQSNIRYYYRIKLINNDQSLVYSNTVGAILQAAPVVELFPNPAGSVTEISWPKGTETAELSIFTAEGKLLYSESKTNPQTASAINLSNFVPGVYPVTIKINGNVSTQKLIITR